jgi:hypothetical protein
LAGTGFFLYGLLHAGTGGDAAWEADEPAAPAHVAANPMRMMIDTGRVGMKRCFITYLLR